MAASSSSFSSLYYHPAIANWERLVNALQHHHHHHRRQQQQHPVFALSVGSVNGHSWAASAHEIELSDQQPSPSGRPSARIRRNHFWKRFFNYTAAKIRRQSRGDRKLAAASVHDEADMAPTPADLKSEPAAAADPPGQPLHNWERLFTALAIRHGQYQPFQLTLDVLSAVMSKYSSLHEQSAAVHELQPSYAMSSSSSSSTLQPIGDDDKWAELGRDFTALRPRNIQQQQGDQYHVYPPHPVLVGQPASNSDTMPVADEVSFLDYANFISYSASDQFFFDWGSMAGTQDFNPIRTTNPSSSINLRPMSPQHFVDVLFECTPKNFKVTSQMFEGASGATTQANMANPTPTHSSYTTQSSNHYGSSSSYVCCNNEGMDATTPPIDSKTSTCGIDSQTPQCCYDTTLDSNVGLYTCVDGFVLLDDGGQDMKAKIWQLCHKLFPNETMSVFSKLDKEKKEIIVSKIHSEFKPREGSEVVPNWWIKDQMVACMANRQSQVKKGVKSSSNKH